MNSLANQATQTVIFQHLLKVDKSLSRTISTGMVNQAVSSLKKPMLVNGNVLESHLLERLEQVARYVSQRACRPAVARGELLAALFSIAEIYSSGIFPEGLFRTWAYSAPIDEADSPEIEVDQIWASLLSLEDAYFTRLNVDASYDMAGWLEWEIGIGPIHPFYDSCGRISRYFSTLVSLWNHQSVPVHTNRDLYMNSARMGVDKFLDYRVQQLRLTLIPVFANANLTIA
jgi:hypothetical protein